MDARQDTATTRHSREAFVKLCQNFTGDIATPCHNNQIRTLQSPNWFTKQASRKNVIKPKGQRCVDEYDVEVASDGPVLKSIVQNNDIGPGADRGFCTGNAIGIGHVTDSGVAATNKQSLVTGVILLRFEPPGNHCRSPFQTPQPFDQIDDHRRFSGSADGDVADADDRNGNGTNAFAAIVSCVANLDRERINPRRGAQSESQRAGP